MQFGNKLNEFTELHERSECNSLNEFNLFPNPTFVWNWYSLYIGIYLKFPGFGNGMFIWNFPVQWNVIIWFNVTNGESIVFDVTFDTIEDIIMREITIWRHLATNREYIKEQISKSESKKVVSSGKKTFCGHLLTKFSIAWD